MLSYIRDINRKYLLSPKILYFFINLQFYTLHQFRGKFAIDHFKVSERVYGIALGALLFLTFFTNIGIATLNDKFNRPRLCLILLLVVSAGYFQLFFVQSFVGISELFFWGNLLLYLIFNTSIPPLLDKITLDQLSRMNNVGPKTYGKQRMWGTLGYLVANWLIEKSIKDSSGTKKKGGKTKESYNFYKLRYYQAITTVIAATLSFFLISVGNTGNARRNDIMRSWKDLVKNKAYMFFILIILLNGVTRAAMTMYLTIYLTDIVKLEGYKLPNMFFPINFIAGIFNENPLATTAFFGVILEIVILYNAEYITNRFGYYWPLLFAQVFQLVRFASYFMLNENATHAFAYACLFELMKGLNFGLTHTSAVQIATRLCPPHLKTTSQMIYSGTFTGLSAVIAGVVFGSVFGKSKMKSGDVTDKVSSFQKFYAINVIINLLCIALFIWKYAVLDGTLSWDVLMGRRREGEILKGEPNEKEELAKEAGKNEGGRKNGEVM